MKKMLFTAAVLLSALLMFACVNESGNNVSFSDTENSVTNVSEHSSDTGTASEAEEVSENSKDVLPEASEPEPEASEPEPEASEPEPEVSEPEPEVSEEESLPYIFTAKTNSAEEISVPKGYEKIVSLIENKEYGKAYDLLKQKEHDVYAEMLLSRFTAFYKEYKNNYVWDQSGVCWAVEIYTLDEKGRLVKSKYSDDYSPNAAGSVFEYVYNENGMLTASRNNSFSYDEQNRLTEIRSKHSDYRIYLQWYDNGLLAKKTVYYSYNGEEDIPDHVLEYFYDKNGRKIREDYYGQSGLLGRVTQWDHGFMGRTENIKVTYRDGKISESTYYYNVNNGLLTEIRTVDSDGNAVTESFTYTADGKLSVHKKYDPNRYYTYFRYQYTYDSNGNVETRTYMNREHLEIDYGTSIYETDKNGNIIRTETYGYNDHSGYVHDIVTRGYDSDGNLAWQNSGDPETDWAWSKRTYGGYTVYYDEYAEFLDLPKFQ